MEVASSVSIDNSLTVLSDINCDSGSIHSGNSVDANGFNVRNLLSWEGNTTTPTGPPGSCNYTITAHTNGVILTDGATSWAAVSERSKKKNLQHLTPLNTTISDIILGHEVNLGHYLNDADDAPLRPFLMFEDAERLWPYAARHNEAQFFVNPKTNQIETQDAFNGLSLEQYVPAIMLALQDIYNRLGVH
jgi:hypothetical protein